MYIYYARLTKNIVNTETTIISGIDKQWQTNLVEMKKIFGT